MRTNSTTRARLLHTIAPSGRRTSLVWDSSFPTCPTSSMATSRWLKLWPFCAILGGSTTWARGKYRLKGEKGDAGCREHCLVRHRYVCIFQEEAVPAFTLLCAGGKKRCERGFLPPSGCSIVKTQHTFPWKALSKFPYKSVYTAASAYSSLAFSVTLYLSPSLSLQHFFFHNLLRNVGARLCASSFYGSMFLMLQEVVLLPASNCWTLTWTLTLTLTSTSTSTLTLLGNLWKRGGLA